MIEIRRIDGWSLASINALALVLTHADVQPQLDARLQTFVGMVDLLDRIRMWHMAAWSCWQGSRICGLGMAELDGTDTAVVHHAFFRKQNVLPMLSELFLRGQMELGLRHFIGYIPKTHRASRLMALRVGMKRVDADGTAPQFMVTGGKLIDCDKFILDWGA